MEIMLNEPWTFCRISNFDTDKGEIFDIIFLTTLNYPLDHQKFIQSYSSYLPYHWYDCSFQWYTLFGLYLYVHDGYMTDFPSSNNVYKCLIFIHHFEIYKIIVSKHYISFFTPLHVKMEGIITWKKSQEECSVRKNFFFNSAMVVKNQTLSYKSYWDSVTRIYFENWINV